MKKNFALAFVILSFHFSDAQLRFGITAGLHSSNIGSTAAITSKSIDLFHGGFIVDMKIPASKFHVQGHALYTSFGYKNSNVSAVDAGGEYIGNIGNEKISYVQIPVLAMYALEMSKKAKLNLGAGPYVAFETNEVLKIDQGGDTFRGSLFPINTTGRSSTVAGGEIYAGLEISKFIVSLQYQRSFNNIYKNSGIDTKWKINNIGFSVGFFLK